jgi:hypothetical protein
MTTEPNRQPEGIPTGGQFAAATHSDDVPDLAPAFNFDTPEDKARFEEAAAFIAESDIEGTVVPLFTQYRPEEGLDAVILTIDGRNMVLRHAGTESPQIEYGDDEDDAWTFRSGPGSTTNKNEHEILADLVTSARHDAACQEAWRRDPSGEAFQYGENVSVNDFGVRYAADGTRIITLDIDNDGRHWELLQRGDEDVKVFISGTEVPPYNDKRNIPLDALACEFDEDHLEGSGDIRWKTMMQAAADRAAAEPGYNPRGVNRP